VTSKAQWSVVGEGDSDSVSRRGARLQAIAGPCGRLRVGARPQSWASGGACIGAGEHGAGPSRWASGDAGMGMGEGTGEATRAVALVQLGLLGLLSLFFFSLFPIPFLFSISTLHLGLLCMYTCVANMYTP